VRIARSIALSVLTVTPEDLLKLVVTRAGLPKLLVMPDEAAEVLSVGRSTVYDLMNRGDLEYVDVGRGRRIKVAVLQAFVARLPSEAPTGLDTGAE
jgi:excisionase family DNA binding protein